MTPPPLERPSYSAASVISMPALGSDISEEELLRNSANFRQFVRDLQTVARTGSIGQVRRILGVDDAFDLESQAFTETEELQMRTAEAQNVQPGPSQTQTQVCISQPSSYSMKAFCKRIVSFSTYEPVRSVNLEYKASRAFLIFTYGLHVCSM